MNELQIERAATLLQQEFGPDWRTIVETLGTEGLRKEWAKS